MLLRTGRHREYIEHRTSRRRCLHALVVSVSGHLNFRSSLIAHVLYPEEDIGRQALRRSDPIRLYLVRAGAVSAPALGRLVVC